MRWPFLRKKSEREPIWTLSTIKTKDGDVVGTHVVRQGANRHRRENPYVAFVTLSYEGKGLPSSEDIPRFDEFDDKLTDCLVRCPGLCVGRFTRLGIRDWICYVKDGKAAANLIYSELSSYSPQIEVVHDPKWTEYRSFAAGSKGKAGSKRRFPYHEIGRSRWL